MKYDLHTHTKYSQCSPTEPELILKAAIKKGLNGIAITDHNEIKGALKVKQLNKNKDFEVIVAEEIQTPKGEILAYYLNTKIKPNTVDIVLDKIKQQGAISSLSHPFAIGARQNAQLTKQQLKRLNAIETFNARSLFKKENIKAKLLATKLKKAQTAGSDAHLPQEVGRAYTITTNLKKDIKNNRTKVQGTNKHSYIYRTRSFITKYLK